MIEKTDTKTSLCAGNLFGEVIPRKSRGVGITRERGKAKSRCTVEAITSVGNWGIKLATDPLRS